MVKISSGFKHYESVDDFKENFNYDEYFEIYGDRESHRSWMNPFIYFFLQHDEIEIKAVDDPGYERGLYDELPGKEKIEGRFNTRVPDAIISVDGEEVAFELKSNINDLRSRLNLQLYEYDYAGYRTAIGLSTHCTSDADHVRLGELCETYDSVLLMASENSGIIVDYPDKYTM